jgi:hypothetical protein
VSEPTRLIEADDAFQRELLLSAERDQPSAHALERALVGLGVGLTAVPLAAAPSAAAATTLSVASLAKWLLTGVALGVVASGSAALSRRLLAQPPGAAASSAGSAMARPVPRHATDPGPYPAATVLPGPEPLPPMAEPLVRVPAARRPNDVAERSSEQPSRVAPAARDGSAQRSFAVEDPARPVPALERETSLVDAARRSLARGDAKHALETLSGYEASFPRGALRPEASVLKVRALLGAGDRAGAEALGRRVITAAPESEHADAVRAALGQRTNP